jgi:hypothetical protein
MNQVEVLCANLKRSDPHCCAMTQKLRQSQAKQTNLVQSHSFLVRQEQNASPSIKTSHEKKIPDPRNFSGGKTNN